MQDHDPLMHQPEPTPRFWQSPTGIVLSVFLVIAVILLGYEHRIHIFGGPSGSFVFLAAWIGMHFLMHRGHGGHESHGGHRGHGDPAADPGSAAVNANGGQS